MIKKLAIMGLFLAVGGCGFQPLYGQKTNDISILNLSSTIEVIKIPGKLGQQFQINLQDRLAPYGLSGNPDYSLKVFLSNTVTGFGFRSDESITRQNLNVEAQYHLTHLASGDLVLSGNANANMTYDVVGSDFSNLSAREDAEKRTGEQIINTIVTRLGFFLKNSQSK